MGGGRAGAPMQPGESPWGTGFELSSQICLRTQHGALSGSLAGPGAGSRRPRGDGRKGRTQPGGQGRAVCTVLCRLTLGRAAPAPSLSVCSPVSRGTPHHASTFVCWNRGPLTVGTLARPAHCTVRMSLTLTPISVGARQPGRDLAPGHPACPRQGRLPLQPAPWWRALGAPCQHLA